ncbi:MAG: L,D-transpeptidase family protein [Bacillota bacterium]|nr:L,D-transpeptidase family protein [Bacillota bacterium]
MRTNIIAIPMMLIFVVVTILAPPAAAANSNNHLVIVNKATNELAYFLNDELIKVFPVATGKTDNLTPEGTYSIVAKFVNPYYIAGNIAGGSPNNPLGVRWMGLNVGSTGGSKYGIHGTNSPDSIGNYVSAGCIRMYNEDVKWLYDQLPMQTTVKIINEPWNLGAKETSLVINESDVSTEDLTNNIFIYKDTLMLPLRALSELLEIKIDYFADHKLIKMQYDHTVAVIDLASNTYFDSQGAYSLAPGAEIKNNVSFVPLEVFKFLGFETVYNKEQGSVSINK